MFLNKYKFKPSAANEKRENIGIIGLGLIGASIARALKPCGKYNIIGCDYDAETVRYAFEHNIIALGHTSVNIMRGCSVVFVCTPSELTVEKIHELYTLLGNQCIITDVAGIKCDIVDKLPDGIRFVGGHPMAGTEKKGIKNSSPTMLQNAYYILTTDNSKIEDIGKISEIVSDMGAITLKCTSAEHDEAVSKISHLPHAVSYCLAAYGTGTELSAKVAAGSFRDMTRVAESPPKFWKEIFLSNASNLCKDLDNLTDALQSLKKAVAEKNGGKLLDILNEGHEGRFRLAQNKSKGIYSIKIDIADKPMAIAKISGILGKSKINIRNISIISSRDASGGVLCVDILGEEEYLSAKEILIKHKYNID